MYAAKGPCDKVLRVYFDTAIFEYLPIILGIKQYKDYLNE